MKDKIAKTLIRIGNKLLGNPNLLVPIIKPIIDEPIIRYDSDKLQRYHVQTTINSNVLIAIQDENDPNIVPKEIACRLVQELSNKIVADHLQEIRSYTRDQNKIYELDLYVAKPYRY